MTETAESEADTPETYVAAFAEYLDEQEWITAAEKMYVLHIKKLCARLDAEADAPAALNSAYLQALSRLDRRRPAPHPAPGSDDDQTDIFDFID